MGVKKFFGWLQKTQSHTLIELNDTYPMQTDNLLIDMNALFHESAQYVYRYGKNKTDKFVVKDNMTQRRKFFEHVCQTIDNYVKFVKPTKHLVLCVDGVAPISKQNQMRSRRLRPNSHAENGGFDSNNISVGTLFMHFLTMYIDAYIKKKVSEDWNFKVIFSNEKVPGEGEHKLIHFIRTHQGESFCFLGLDADLIFLSMFTHVEKIHILRENQYRRSQQDCMFYLVDIDAVKKSVKDILTTSEYNDEKSLVNDFVFICFLVGNDFLPHIPCIEIIMNGMEILSDIYKKVAEKFGYLVNISERIELNIDAICEFFRLISEQEQSILCGKIDNGKFFEDAILKACTVYNPESDEYTVDIKKYRSTYNQRFEHKHKVIEHYMTGLFWVLKYYSCNSDMSKNSQLSNIDWGWYYPHHYAPFAHDIYKYLKTHDLSFSFGKNPPISSLQQLLSILPKRNKDMVPTCLQDIMPNSDEEVKIDLSGMTQEWEGIALVPFLDYTKFNESYGKRIAYLTDNEKKLNEKGSTFQYYKTTRTYRAKLFNHEFEHSTQRDFF